MSSDKAAVTLGVDVGGTDAHAATTEVCMELRQALASECRGPYGPSFAEFALVVRIDGSVQRWGKSGVDNVRLQRVAKYATVDIFVPQTVWDAGPAAFRSFLATNILAAIEAIVDRAVKTKARLDSDHLVADVSRATRNMRS
jgi:hypothetical protein